MADKADRINYDGSITPGILADRLGEFDRNAEYHCCGRVNGEKCNAPLTLVISKYGNYFREKSSAEPHKRGCKYKNDALAKIVANLDHLGSNQRIDDMFSLISNLRKSPSLSPSHGGTIALGASDDISKKIEIKPLVYTKRQPRNLKELYNLLLIKDLSEPYADTIVGDIIIKQDNIAYYRNNRIYPGQKLIVKCSRVNPKKYSIPIPPYSVIVQDAYSYEDRVDPILFIIRTSSKSARGSLFDAICKNGVVIWGEWFPYKSYQNVYICNWINQNMFYAPDPKGY